MSHINDIQQRKDAKVILPFLLYVFFLGFILFFAIHFSWEQIPLEILILPILFTVPLFTNRIYLSLILILAGSVLIITQWGAPLQFTYHPFFNLVLIVLCIETLIFFHLQNTKEHRHFLKQAADQINHLSVLRNIDIAMITNAPLPDTLRIVAQELSDRYGFDSVNLLVLDRKSNLLQWCAGNAQYFSAQKTTPQNHPAGDLSENRSMQILPLNADTPHNMVLNQYAENGYKVYIVLPLVYNNLILGTLEILHNKALIMDDQFTDSLVTLGGQAAIAIEHATSLAYLQEINFTLQSTIKELTETKEVLEKSQHIGRIGSWRYTVSTGVVEWTQALYDIYGIQSDITPTFNSILNHIVPEDVDHVKSRLDDLLEGRSILELQYRIRHPDGSLRNLITMCETYSDESGRVTEIIGTVRDRTEHKQAEVQIREAHLQLQQSYDSTLEGWARALELRDHDTEGHSQRVTHLSLQLADILQIPQSELIHIRRGAILHDIGKIGIPDTILLKPGQLTADEWKIMRQHPQFAYDMLSPISHLHPALDIPYCHHEKWDGTGYPQGLKGSQIPLSARIFAVIDVLDALLSDRPYRKAWTLEETKAYIIQQSGTYFDPEIVTALISNWNRMKF